MQCKDMIAYHKAQAKIFHERAQVARKEGLLCKERRDHIGKLKSDMRAQEYRRSRDHHKAKAKRYTTHTPS